MQRRAHITLFAQDPLSREHQEKRLNSAWAYTEGGGGLAASPSRHRAVRTLFISADHISPVGEAEREKGQLEDKAGNDARECGLDAHHAKTKAETFAGGPLKPGIEAEDVLVFRLFDPREP